MLTTEAVSFGDCTSGNGWRSLDYIYLRWVLLDGSGCGNLKRLVFG